MGSIDSRRVALVTREASAADTADHESLNHGRLLREKGWVDERCIQHRPGSSNVRSVHVHSIYRRPCLLYSKPGFSAKLIRILTTVFLAAHIAERQ